MLEPRAAEAAERVPPRLEVRGRVLGEKGELVPGDTLAHDEQLLFDSTLLALHRSEETSYRWQLVPHEDAPNDWTSDHRVRYGRLPAGGYRLLVWARDYTGGVSGPVQIPFHVRPAPWLTWWAYLLYAGLVAGAGYSLVSLRLRAVERHNAELEALVTHKTEDIEQALVWTREAVRQAETLRASAEALSQSLELQQVLQLILTELRRVVDYDSASVQELRGGTLHILAGVGFPNLEEIIGLTFDVNDPSAPNGQVVNTRETLILADTSAYPPFSSGYNAPAPILSWLGVPLIRGHRVIGLITIDKREPGFFTQRHAQLAAIFAAQAAISLENAQLLEREKQAHARAEEASRAKSAFVASMSHELRTPLNAILGYVQLMQRRAGRDAEDREHLEVINRSGDHLLGLINQVLSLAKIESGRITLHPTAFDLAELVRSVGQMFRPRAAAKGLEFRVHADALPRSVHGDELRLREILLNLLGNAFKFTQRGHVTLRASWRAGLAAFEVEDTGPGMSGDDTVTLFAAFSQTETGRHATEGTGLGLALSREFARLMGGEITVESEPGHGSVFRVEVRLDEAGELDEGGRAHRDVRRVRSLAPDEPRLRLLVADDNDDGRALLGRLLGSVGFEVSQVADGRQAVEAWRRERPRLVWMDVGMPVLDGLTATREIRALEAAEDAARTPIIAVTASAFEHEREAVVAAGCDGFLPKPFQAEDVYAIAALHLGVRYVYEEETEPGPTPAAVGALTRERVGTLPSPWLDRFRRALVEGDAVAADRLVHEIEPVDAPLAQQLHERLRAYRFDELELLVGLAAAPPEDP